MTHSNDPDFDLEFMDKSQLKTAARAARKTNRDVASVVQTWIDKQGHDRCWYYPDLFLEICSLLGVQQTNSPSLPSEEDFKSGCERYRTEQYKPVE